MTGDNRVAAEDMIRLLELVRIVADRIGGIRNAIDLIERLVMTADMMAPASRSPAQFARLARKLRLRRNDRLGAALCRDPAWDMLLDLIGSTERQPVAISTLCADAGVPPTTALRHVQHLADAGLISRTADRSDQRRVLVDLTDKGIERVTGVIRQMQGLTTGTGSDCAVS